MSNLHDMDELLAKVYDSDTWFFMPSRRAWEELCALLDSSRDSDSETEDEVILCREM